MSKNRLPNTSGKPSPPGQPGRIVPLVALLLVLVAIGAVLFGKSQAQPTTPTFVGTGDLPEAQLSQALAVGKPTLAFFHSNTCDQCIQMTKIVEQVYPEFAATVALVDVNVYADSNTKLLQKAGIRYIPTLIFYDRAGKSQTSVGVMEAAKFRQTLAGLAAQ